MSENAPVVTPSDPPAPVVPPDPSPAAKKLLDDLKKEQAKRKELEAKLAEALPYLEKFKTHDEAKALEAQRAAEARAKQEAESTARHELEGKRERAILKALIGVVPQGDSELGEFALWKLSTDPSITHDPETGTFNGLAEAVAALQASPRFAAGKPGEQTRRAAPGLPDTRGRDGGAGALHEKFKSVTTLLHLQALPVADQMEYARSYPAEYEALRLADRARLARPLPTAPPPMGQSYQSPNTAAKR